MPLIDPTQIFAAVQNATQLGAQSSAKLAQPFLDKVTSRDIGSGDNASQIVDGVMSACQEMLGQMDVVKAAVLNQLAVIQDGQRRETTYDFKPNINDLRPTDAQGWPKELADEFFKPFFGK